MIVVATFVSIFQLKNSFTSYLHIFAISVHLFPVKLVSCMLNYARYVMAYQTSFKIFELLYVTSWSNLIGIFSHDPVHYYLWWELNVFIHCHWWGCLYLFKACYMDDIGHWSVKVIYTMGKGTLWYMNMEIETTQMWLRIRAFWPETFLFASILDWDVYM